MHESERLDALADVLTEAITADGFGQKSQLVRIVGELDADDEWELGFRDLDGEHPALALLGFTAPPEWSTLGTLTGGWVAPMDGDCRASAHPDAVRIRMVVLVTRSGHVASRVRTADGRAIDDPGEGFMLDVLRRALGLPTPPPEASTTELITALWLSEIAGAAEEARTLHARRLTWSQVTRLHPAMALLAQGGKRSRPDALVPTAQALGNVLTWKRVREQAVERSWLAGLVSQDIARWMDEGMLSRWLIGELPPIGDLVEHVSRMLRPDVAGQLDDALAELATTGGDRQAS